MNRNYSLKSKREFNDVINKGQKLRSQYLFISTVKADDFKVGISVPKKLGNAVFRNRNKRVIREIIASIAPYNIKKHVVIVVKKEFTELSFELKRQTLEKDFKKAL